MKTHCDELSCGIPTVVYGSYLYQSSFPEDNENITMMNNEKIEDTAIRWGVSYKKLLRLAQEEEGISLKKHT